MKHIIYKLHPALAAKPKQRPRSLFHATAIPFLRQGDLDGACGIYTLWLSMTIFKFVNLDAIYSGRAFKKPELKRAWQKSMELFICGADEDEMCALLKTVERYVHHEEVSASMSAVIDFTVESLDKSALVILGFETNSGDGHWMLAVGMEGVQTGSRFIPTGILCIDSEEPAPTLAPFNVRVMLNASNSGDKFTQYFSSSGDRQNVTLTSAFAVSKRK